MNDSRKGHNDVSVSDVEVGKLDPSSLGSLDVHRGSDGENWCHDNWRLWEFLIEYSPSTNKNSRYGYEKLL